MFNLFTLVLTAAALTANQAFPNGNDTVHYPDHNGFKVIANGPKSGHIWVRLPNGTTAMYHHQHGNRTIKTGLFEPSSGAILASFQTNGNGETSQMHPNPTKKPIEPPYLPKDLENLQATMEEALNAAWKKSRNYNTDSTEKISALKQILGVRSQLSSGSAMGGESPSINTNLKKPLPEFQFQENQNNGSGDNTRSDKAN